MYPILVWYINKMANDGEGGVAEWRRWGGGMEEVGWWNGGGGVVEWRRWGGGWRTATIASVILYWSPVEIPTCIQFFLANFHVSTILAISTYIRPNI